MHISFVSWIFSAVVISLLAACSSESQSFVFQGAVMGTSYSVKVVTPEALSTAQQGVLDVEVGETLARVDQLMSTYKPDSELMRFNTAIAGQSVQWSADTLTVLDLSMSVFKESEGFFDPSIGPLVSRWGFGPQELGSAPGKEEVDRLLKQAGMKHFSVHAEDGTLTKLGAGFIDFSAVAKGYAVDKVAELLTNSGYSNFLVEVGGEVTARGRNKLGKIWRLGIEQPDFGGRKAYTIVNLENKAMATSGDYRNFVEIEGVRYSHTIDPKTGYPIQSNLASVTVVHESCALADAWATALNAMGFDVALEFAKQNNLDAYFIVRTESDFEAFSSPGFDRLAM